MATNILMPALSPTMEKGNLAKWLKSEGDKVKAGDVIAEIETDKATMEVEAVDEGTLGKILIPEGTADVAVNTPIAVILGDGENASDIKASAPRSAPDSAIRQHVEESEPRVEETNVVKAPAKPASLLPNPTASNFRRFRKAPRLSPSPCAKRCATPWPRRCAATAMSSSWARRSQSTRAPTR